VQERYVQRRNVDGGRLATTSKINLAATVNILGGSERQNSTPLATFGRVGHQVLAPPGTNCGTNSLGGYTRDESILNVQTTYGQIVNRFAAQIKTALDNCQFNARNKSETSDNNLALAVSHSLCPTASHLYDIFERSDN
jgi:hypothetical protein